MDDCPWLEPQPTKMNCCTTCISLWLLQLNPTLLCLPSSKPRFHLLSPPLPSPPVRLDISGTSLIIRLQWSAMLTGCPLMAVPHSSTTAAALCRREVIIALPLSLQSQLVSVVLNVRLLLQSHVHLQRKKSSGCNETWGDQDTNRHMVLLAARGIILCVKN